MRLSLAHARALGFLDRTVYYPRARSLELTPGRARTRGTTGAERMTWRSARDVLRGRSSTDVRPAFGRLDLNGRIGMVTYMAPRIDYGRLRQNIVQLLQSCRGGKAASLGYDIEDLVQDTIAMAIGRDNTTAAFDPARSKWTTWIVRVADDVLRSEYRRQAARQKAARPAASFETAAARAGHQRHKAFQASREAQ